MDTNVKSSRRSSTHSTLCQRLRKEFNFMILDYTHALLICPALFLYIISSCINTITLYGLVYSKICLNEFNVTICNSLNNKDKKYSIRLQELSTHKNVELNIAFVLPAFFVIIKLASMGDHLRNYKIPLIISLVGGIIHSLINIFATNQTYSLSFSMLLSSQFINGLCGGGSLSFISSCFSHITVNEHKVNDNIQKQRWDKNTNNGDCDNEKQCNSGARRLQQCYKVCDRQKYSSIRYSICESCLLLGNFIGSFSSGYIIGNGRELSNIKRTYVLSFSLYLFVLFYTICVFKFIKTRNDSGCGVGDGDEYDNTLIKKSEICVDIGIGKDEHCGDAVNIDYNIQQQQQQEQQQKQSGHIRLFICYQFRFLCEAYILLMKNRANGGKILLITIFILYFLKSSLNLSTVQYLYLIKNPISLSQIQFGTYKATNTLCRALSLLVFLPLLKRLFNIH